MEEELPEERPHEICFDPSPRLWLLLSCHIAPGGELPVYEKDRIPCEPVAHFLPFSLAAHMITTHLASDSRVSAWRWMPGLTKISPERDFQTKF